MPERTAPRNLVLHIEGIVQGVGFRPFIYKLAHELSLTGWVNNSAQGVQIEVAGHDEDIRTFVKRLLLEKPQHAHIVSLQQRWVDPQAYDDFTIRSSDVAGDKSALMMPDLAICPDCLHDILDKTNPRYRYPFTNCTHCGPRYSIIQSLPYDRTNTTMWHFNMCDHCREEYENPLDRRFHAQPNACSECGPQLALWDDEGNSIALNDDALVFAGEAIKQGQIVACKGLGGFHFLVDARNHRAVERLRKLKQRPHKPLATMFPSLEMTEWYCDVTPLESEILQSSAAPIVLLRKAEGLQIADCVAPDNPYLGVMLPYTPLHVLLMQDLGFPIVATSGNFRDEPICVDEYEALERLSPIADVFLVHNRPIERPVDDSVVQVVNGELQILRRARGYAPLSIDLPDTQPEPILAVGGHLKNTVAITHHQQLLLSQHIGDLGHVRANALFQCTIEDLKRMYNIVPEKVVHDHHPDYLSTQYADQCGLPSYGVQHHVAHVLSGMIDNHLTDHVLGVSWDGTGFGTDHTVWGGEWFLVSGTDVERVAHLRPFALPGGDIATLEPRRSALGVLYDLYGNNLFDINRLPLWKAFRGNERKIIQAMLVKHINTPLTSSMGRLFDAVASILNLSQISTYEGQGAMAVEFAAMRSNVTEGYPFSLTDSGVDWRPMIEVIVADELVGVPAPQVARKFHNTLANMILTVAETIGEENVLLTGGCFQNRLLSEIAIARLKSAGFKPYWHHHIPPNDGGIAIGQVMAVKHHITLKESAACV